MEMNFDEWIQYGIDNGFCSEQYCNTHEVPTFSMTEAIIWDDGGDPCLHVVRLGSAEDWEKNAKAWLAVGQE